jgi:hypothetical protein
MSWRHPKYRVRRIGSSPPCTCAYCVYLKPADSFRYPIIPRFIKESCCFVLITAGIKTKSNPALMNASYAITALGKFNKFLCCWIADDCNLVFRGNENQTITMRLGSP